MNTRYASLDLRYLCLRTFVLIVAALLLAPLCARAQGQEAESERPNILFIFSDDHAAQAVGAYDSWLSEWVHTPNIDQLAREGMLFQNAYVTNSICAPSRAVILTGLHSHITGVETNQREDKLPVKFDTFPELLQTAGYQTALIGKWHLKSDPQGFDYWEVLPGQGRYYNPAFKTPEGRTQYTGYVSDIITDRAIHWLEEERDGEEPFLLMYQHKAPHRNWQPAPEQLDLYAEEEIPPPKTLFYDYSGLSSAAAMQEMEVSTDLRWGWDLKLPVAPGNRSDSTSGFQRFFDRYTPEQRAAWTAAYGPRNEQFYEKYGTGALQGRDLTRWKYQRYIKDYLRTVASMDQNIGRILDYLEENGLAENTVVVYTSDQGFFLGENGWFDKRWIYKESMRIPLIVRWPGVVEPGSESTALVQNLDFAETFLDVAGVEIPERMQGRSLVPTLKGETPSDWREAVYYHYYEFPRPHHVAPHEGVRTDRYVLVHYYTLGQWELFDLRKDSEELHSVYGNPAYADVTERLKTKLEQLKDKYQVPEDAVQDAQRTSSMNPE